MSHDYVIDASALVLALIGREDAAEALRGRLEEMRRHAPHLIDVELGNVLCRHEQRGLISTTEALTALDAGQALIEHRYPHAGPLARAAWDLRGNLSFYDALYVALATQLDATLLTVDAKLARAPGLRCPVELV